MTRVGTVVGRDAMPKPFDIGLHIVVPLGSDLGTFDSGYQNCTKIVLAEEFLLLVGEVGARQATFLKGCAVVGRTHKVSRTRNTRNGLMGRIEHQAGNLFDRQLGSQVLGALFGRETPVLVLVEFTITVQVLELVTILFEQLHTRLRRIAEGGTALLNHEIILSHRPLLVL